MASDTNYLDKTTGLPQRVDQTHGLPVVPSDRYGLPLEGDPTRRLLECVLAELCTITGLLQRLVEE